MDYLIPDLLRIVYSYAQEYLMGVYYEDDTLYVKNILTDRILFTYPVDIKGEYYVHIAPNYKRVIIGYRNSRDERYILVFDFNGHLHKRLNGRLSHISNHTRIYSDNNLSYFDIPSNEIHTVGIRADSKYAYVIYVSYDDRTKLVYDWGYSIYRDLTFVGRPEDYAIKTIANARFYVNSYGIYDYLHNNKKLEFSASPIDFLDNNTFLGILDNKIIQMDIDTYPKMVILYTHDSPIYYGFTIRRNGDKIVLNYERLHMIILITNEVRVIRYTHNYQCINVL